MYLCIVLWQDLPNNWLYIMTQSNHYYFTVSQPFLACDSPFRWLEGWQTRHRVDNEPTVAIMIWTAAWGEIHNKAVWGHTCITCWRPSHSLAHHTQTASPWCEHEHGSWGCKRWGRPCHSPVDCTRMCTRPGVSSGVSAGFPPCCTSLCSLRTCTGSASPGRRRGGNQRLNMLECNSNVWNHPEAKLKR